MAYAMIMANQKNRKLGVFGRKFWREAALNLIDIVINIRPDKPIMLKNDVIDMNVVGIRTIIYNLQVITQEAAQKTTWWNPPGPY